MLRLHQSNCIYIYIINHPGLPPACRSEIKLLPNNIVYIYAYIYTYLSTHTHIYIYILYTNHSSRLKTAKGPPQQTDGTQFQRIDFRERVHPAVDR